jgi:CHAD domain-containing protein/HD superfamily phosphodiesterase
LKPASKTTGLRYWMLRVLDECDNASAGFSADPVHDLRVSLRRCRSMADGMIAMDPDPDWKAMKKSGKKLFQSLGALRDVQVMMDWIEKLEFEKPIVARTLLSASPAEEQNEAESLQVYPLEVDSLPEPEAHDPAAQALLHILRSRETEQKHLARAALGEFDRKQWRQWSKSLPMRGARIRPGSVVFKHLALERWIAARDLHIRAMRNRSQVALHTLRIGIKRFRYIVENFLPVEHKAWSGDLKHMQDLLGEVHDLDVLWTTALSCRAFPDEQARKAWHARIVEERKKRVDEYREKTIGPDSLWTKWRAGLPQGKQIRDLATRRLKLWAKVLDPDVAHSERVARFALELFDGLAARGLLAFLPTGLSPEAQHELSADARVSLFGAALMHDVGKSRGSKGHHKESMHLIQKHGAPLGWKSENLARAAVVARFHCGPLPVRTHKSLRNLPPDEQRTIIRLSAILRLANALDSAHDGHIRRVKIENPAASASSLHRVNGHRQANAVPGKGDALIIAAEGYADGSSTAQAVAAERYLLETVLRRPVMVRAMKTSPARNRAA